MLEPNLFNIVWAIGALVLSVWVLLFTKQFLELNAKLFQFLFEKTNFSLFAHGVEKMKSDEMKVVSWIASGLLLFTSIRILMQLFS